MAQLNWRKRAFDFKLKRALKDEEEFCKTDRAARFIERVEQSRWAPRPERCKTAAEANQAEADRRTQASGNHAARVQEKPPWED
jgi:hypothetical protein